MVGAPSRTREYAAMLAFLSAGLLLRHVHPEELFVLDSSAARSAGEVVDRIIQLPLAVGAHPPGRVPRVAGRVQPPARRKPKPAPSRRPAPQQPPPPAPPSRRRTRRQRKRREAGASPNAASAQLPAEPPPRFFRATRETPLWDVGESHIQRAEGPEGVAEVETPVAPPSTLLQEDGWPGLLDFVTDGPFEELYWERWPVLVRTGSLPPAMYGPDGASDGAGGKALLGRLLSDSAGYSTIVDGLDEGSIRTVTYLNGSFTNKLSPQPQRQREPQLRAALELGLTIQMGRVQNWVPAVASLALDVLDATGRQPNVNAYITPQGRAVAMAAHNDFQCSLMVQLVGHKRWRLWLAAPDTHERYTDGGDEGDGQRPSECAEGWGGSDCMSCAAGFICGEWPTAVRAADAGLSLPVRNTHIRGRNEQSAILQPENLPSPYMDVTLAPGDVLYVPRGCLHWTATPAAAAADDTEPSFHLTVGLETMLDGSRLSHSWESVLGLNGGRHEHVTEAFFSALGRLVNAKRPRRRHNNKDNAITAAQENGGAGGSAIDPSPQQEDTQAYPFRASVPRSVLLGGAWAAARDRDAATPTGAAEDGAQTSDEAGERHKEQTAARERARSLLHLVVDEMVDGTPMLSRIGAHLTHELALYRQRLERVTLAAVLGRPLSLGGKKRPPATPTQQQVSRSSEEASSADTARGGGSTGQQQQQQQQQQAELSQAPSAETARSGDSRKGGPVLVQPLQAALIAELKASHGED